MLGLRVDEGYRPGQAQGYMGRTRLKARFLLLRLKLRLKVMVFELPSNTFCSKPDPNKVMALGYAKGNKANARNQL